MNVPLSRLYDCVTGQDFIYYYVIRSIRKHNGELSHFVSG
jgi:hypothetical protein